MSAYPLMRTFVSAIGRSALYHKRTKLLSQFAAQDMPTCSSSANLVKSCRYERLYVSHKAIAGGAWIDGIRFDHGSTTLLGVLHRCFDDLFGQSLSTQGSTNEEAGQRPYLFGYFASPVR